MRNRAFLAAAATSSIVALYFALVAGRALVFISPRPARKGLGIALLVIPLIGAWWLFHEWRLGAAVQGMADALEREGRLPVFEGEGCSRTRHVRSARRAFEIARREVELQPDDWAAWFHVAFAYDAAGDRTMARKSFRHAATLYGADRAAQRAAQ